MKVGKNRAPPRTQSAVKQTELFKTLQTLISQGIVEKSQSPHYSQILVVPKPDGTFPALPQYAYFADLSVFSALSAGAPFVEAFVGFLVLFAALLGLQ